MQRNLDTHFLPPNHVGGKSSLERGLVEQCVKDKVWVLNNMQSTWFAVHTVDLARCS